jgi:hypothetical protein
VTLCWSRLWLGDRGGELPPRSTIQRFRRSSIVHKPPVARAAPYRAIQGSFSGPSREVVLHLIDLELLEDCAEQRFRVFVSAFQVGSQSRGEPPDVLAQQQVLIHPASLCVHKPPAATPPPHPATVVLRERDSRQHSGQTKDH